MSVVYQHYFLFASLDNLTKASIPIVNPRDLKHSIVFRTLVEEQSS